MQCRLHGSIRRAMRCGALRCAAMRCGAVRCDAMRARMGEQIVGTYDEASTVLLRGEENRHFAGNAVPRCSL